MRTPKTRNIIIVVLLILITIVIPVFFKDYLVHPTGKFSFLYITSIPIAIGILLDKKIAKLILFFLLTLFAIPIFSILYSAQREYMFAWFIYFMLYFFLLVLVATSKTIDTTKMKV